MNRRAFLLGAAMVLACNLVAVALRSFAEARFLAAYGPTKLPWLLVASAGGFAIATLGYDAITRRARTGVVDFALLGLLGLTAAIAPTLLARGAPPVLLVVALAAMSQVAGLALWNRVAASVAGRDARRMLPRAGAAVTAGGAIAGLGAAPLVPRLGADVLPYVGAVVTLVAIVLAVMQQRALAAGGAPGATAPPGTSQKLPDVQKKLLGALIAVALLEGIVATVVDLQFVAQLKRRYHGDELAAMVSLFYGGTNALLLLLQVTAVPRILVTRSLPTTLAIHPIVMIAAYVGFAAAPSFFTIAGARTSDQVLRLATSRTGQEISLSPLPPDPRARWKVLLRGAMWPAGAALAALGILAIGPAALAHPDRLAAVAIAVAVIWAIVAQIAARRFQTALAAPLGIKARRVEDVTRIDLATLERWTHAAGDADPRVAALARAALARARVAASDLADQLTNDEPAVRAALFDQLARAPEKSVRNELRAAVMIEDDDRAFALGLKAMAIGGDDAALGRASSRAAVSKVIADVARSAELTLRGGAGVAEEVGRLCARDPGWAIALVRARRRDVPDPDLTRVLGAAAASTSTARAGALAVVAAAGSRASMALLGDALAAGEPDATAAIAQLDELGALHLATHVAALPGPARLAIARALAGAPAGTNIVAILLADPDAEVAHAALRTALAVTRGGGALPPEPIAAARTAALAALGAHLDTRDATPGASPLVKAEIELATRGCVARLLWAVAVEAAAAGRDPATLTATARRLVVGTDMARKRALDVVQELQAGSPEILAVLERWLRPAAPSGSAAGLRAHDPWLADLVDGKLSALEPTLAALRAPALFAQLPGPALAELASRATRKRVEGALFAEGEPGATMAIVASGKLLARRGDGPARAIGPGGVVGELAVLTQAPRAATIIADGPTEVLELDREAFAAAARRAPELVLGLTATLAGWLAANRPDMLTP